MKKRWIRTAFVCIIVILIIIISSVFIYAKYDKRNSTPQLELGVGETAEFEGYSITLERIVQKDGFVFASLVMRAGEATTFKNSYIRACSSETGECFETIDQDPTEKVKAGRKYMRTLCFNDYGIDEILWDCRGDRVCWKFSSEPSNNRNDPLNDFFEEPQEDTLKEYYQQQILNEMNLLKTEEEIQRQQEENALENLR